MRRISPEDVARAPEGPKGETSNWSESRAKARSHQSAIGCWTSGFLGIFGKSRDIQKMLFDVIPETKNCRKARSWV